MIGAEAAGSGYHPIMIDKGHGDDRSFGWGWIFALVIIFLALVFLWGRRGDEGSRGQNDTLLPFLAANATKHHDGHSGSYEHWDIARDELREFGDVKKEIIGAAYAQSRESDRYFFETNRAIDRNQHDTLLGFKNSEILGLQNTGEVLKRIDGLERRYDQDKIQELRDKLNHMSTVAALAPRPPIPAYFPRYEMPVQHNVYAYEQACHPNNC